MQRRDLLQSGALAAIALLSDRAFAQSGAAGGKLIPLERSAAAGAAAPGEHHQGSDALGGPGSWITPNEKFFSIAHYNRPVIDDKTWRLDVAGMVAKPLTLTLDELKAMPRQEVTCTIECSGNNGLPFFTSAVGNARWAGTSLAGCSRRRRSSMAPSKWSSTAPIRGEEVVHKDTPLEVKFTGNFARSMSLDDAMNPANLLCYEMNGSPLPAANGFPVRLIAPGWYGVANVKWLTRHRSARHPLPRTLHGPRLRHHPRGGA